jgi:Mrp family chromosome partitioning ATPase
MARVYEALMLARASCPKTDEFLGGFDQGEAPGEAGDADFDSPHTADSENLRPATPHSVASGERGAVEGSLWGGAGVALPPRPPQKGAESEACEPPAAVRLAGWASADESEGAVAAAMAAAAEHCLAESDDVDLDAGQESVAEAVSAEAVSAAPSAVTAFRSTGRVPAPWREEFAQLAEVVVQARGAGRLQVLAVCGAARGDGASFVAHNLSLALAEAAGLRVARFEVGASAEAGLTVVKAPEAASFKVAIRRTPAAGVSEITTPQGGVTLASLLGGCDTGVLLEMLRQRFDLVLLDLPAVTAEAEAARFAAQADGVIIVAQQEGERRSPVAEARALLAAANANILGVVLNHRGEADGDDVRQVA